MIPSTVDTDNYARKCNHNHKMFCSACKIKGTFANFVESMSVYPGTNLALNSDRLEGEENLNTSQLLDNHHIQVWTQGSGLQGQLSDLQASAPKTKCDRVPYKLILGIPKLGMNTSNFQHPQCIPYSECSLSYARYSTATTS